MLRRWNTLPSPGSLVYVKISFPKGLLFGDNYDDKITKVTGKDGHAKHVNSPQAIQYLPLRRPGIATWESILEAVREFKWGAVSGSGVSWCCLGRALTWCFTRKCTAQTYGNKSSAEIFSSLRNSPSSFAIIMDHSFHATPSNTGPPLRQAVSHRFYLLRRLSIPLHQPPK